VFFRVLYLMSKNLIREAREALGLTIVELSEKVGVHYTTVSEWELGKTIPRFQKKNALSKVLGRSVEDLFPIHNLPEAIYEGVLQIGDKEIDCAVLENGKRVLTQSAVFEAFGRPPRGNMPSRNRNNEVQLPGFMDAKNLRPFITPEVIDGIKVIEYACKSGKVKLGYDATVIPSVCDVYLLARNARVLTANQLPLADVSELIVRSLSKVGILALVDEVTGYQQYRERNELHKLLAKYLSQEKLAWTKRFPDEFFKQLYRLKNWDYPAGNGGHTPLVGKLINQLVYEKLPPGVLEELRKLNPTDPDTKRRKWKHHQFLSEDVGQPDLRDHLLQVIAIMRGSPDWRNFEDNFFRAFPDPKAISYS
jgi:transcriptional regulator with XRE-family HTH domain